MTCNQGFSKKCYTDGTFLHEESGDPANCNGLFCPSMTINAGVTKEGIAGPQVTNKLINRVSPPIVIRCEAAPCLANTDPAFTVDTQRVSV